MGKRTNRCLTQAECDRLKRLCQTYTQRDAAAILGVTEYTVSRIKSRGWLATPGVIGRRRPRPSDFALLASKMSLRELQDHYGCHHVTLARWLEGVERNYKKKRAHEPFPVPPDFEKVWRKLGSGAAARHYGVAPSTAHRWQKLLGLFKRRRKAANENGVGWVERYVEQHRRAA